MICFGGAQVIRDLLRPERLPPCEVDPGRLEAATPSTDGIHGPAPNLERDDVPSLYRREPRPQVSDLLDGVASEGTLGVAEEPLVAVETALDLEPCCEELAPRNHLVDVVALQHEGTYAFDIDADDSESWRVVSRPLGPKLHSFSGRGDKALGSPSVPAQVVVDYKDTGSTGGGGGDFYLEGDGGVLSTFTAVQGSDLTNLEGQRPPQQRVVARRLGPAARVRLRERHRQQRAVLVTRCSRSASAGRRIPCVANRRAALAPSPLAEAAKAARGSVGASGRALANAPDRAQLQPGCGERVRHGRHDGTERGEDVRSNRVGVHPHHLAVPAVDESSARGGRCGLGGPTVLAQRHGTGSTRQSGHVGPAHGLH